MCSTSISESLESRLDKRSLIDKSMSEQQFVSVGVDAGDVGDNGESVDKGESEVRGFLALRDRPIVQSLLK